MANFKIRIEDTKERLRELLQQTESANRAVPRADLAKLYDELEAFIEVELFAEYLDRIFFRGRNSADNSMTQARLPRPKRAINPITGRKNKVKNANRFGRFLRRTDALFESIRFRVDVRLGVFNIIARNYPIVIIKALERRYGVFLDLTAFERAQIVQKIRKLIDKYAVSTLTPAARNLRRVAAARRSR